MIFHFPLLGIAKARCQALLSVSLPHFLLVPNSVSEPFQFVKPVFVARTKERCHQKDAVLCLGEVCKVFF
jgi:hypothetical protein